MKTKATRRVLDTAEKWPESEIGDFLVEVLAIAARSNEPVTMRVAEKLQAVLERKIGESEKPEYTGRHGGPVGDDLERVKANIFARVDNMPSDRLPALAKLIDEFERTNGEVAASQPAKQSPRPKWPQDALPGENPAYFAWRAYAVEAAAGTLHLGVIRQENEALAVKLVSWLRSPANRKQVPEGFDIPTKPEWNTRQIEAGKAKPAPAPRTEGQRLYDAVVKRRARESAPAATNG